MRRLRAIVKLTALVLTNLGFYLFIVVTSSTLGLWNRITGRPSGTGGWRTEIFHAWGRTMTRLLGIQVRVRGSAPRPPFVFVSNHLGYVDVVLLASVLRCVFVSKAEVRHWPVVGRLCASVDTLFIQREQKRDIPRVMRQMERVLESGRGIVLFPEGTSSGGEGVLPFRASLLDSAARSGRPVYHAAIAYRTPPGHRPAAENVCWWGNMPFGTHVFNLLALPGFEARIAFGEEPILESNRKELADRLQREVERQLQTVI